MSTPPEKNSTKATDTSSVGLATMVMLAGVTKLAPFVGLVMLTCGRALIKMLTGAEVVLRPRLSVATAGMRGFPEGAVVQVAEWGLIVAVPSLSTPSK